MKGKMAIVGDGDGILAFSSVGVDAYPVNKPADADKLIKSLAEEYGVIFVTENVARENEKRINEYLTVPYPVIITVPSGTGDNSGYGMKGVYAAMEKALGINIFAEDAGENSRDKNS